MIITVNIEAETSEEYREGLQALCDGLSQKESCTRIDIVQEPCGPAPEKKAEEKPAVFSKNSYFYHAESDDYLAFKKGEEIPQDADFQICTPIAKKEYDAAIKKQKEESAKKTEKSAVSTGSTSDTEPSKTGEPAEPTENEDVEKDVSATKGAYPDATKADIVAAMQEAQKAGKLSAVKTALGRFNATKISELKEEHFSAFLTDLEVLVKE